MTAPMVDFNYRFGHFELQPRERRLLVDGKPATVGGRSFDLLVALVQRTGQLVTKDDLLDLVWPNVVVEENNLHTQVSALRKILGSDAIESIPGQGYRFAMSPVRSVAARLTPPSGPLAIAERSPPYSAKPASTGLRILLIDDHTLFREAIGHVLTGLDEEVVLMEGGTAEEAIDMVRHYHDFDLILLDLNMPGMGGLSGIPKLLDLAPTVPVVVISASVRSTDVRSAVEAGAAGYIPKTSSSHELSTALRAVLAGSVYIPPALLPAVDGKPPGPPG